VRREILSGWRDIANYLGIDVRTVQRYEREFGLPILRPPGKAQGTVLAARSELDTWAAGRLSGRSRSPIAAAIPQPFVSLKQRIAEMDELSKRIKRQRLEILEMFSETFQRIHDEAKREGT
jgi:hypothetical protein